MIPNYNQWRILINSTVRGVIMVTINRDVLGFDIDPTQTIFVDRTTLFADDELHLQKVSEEDGLILWTDLSELKFFSPFTFSGVVDGTPVGEFDLRDENKSLFEHILFDDNAKYRLRISHQLLDGSWEHLFCGEFRRKDFKFSEDDNIVEGLGSEEEMSEKIVTINTGSLWQTLKELKVSDLSFDITDMVNGIQTQFIPGLAAYLPEDTMKERLKRFSNGFNDKLNLGVGKKASGLLTLNGTVFTDGQTVTIDAKTYTYKNTPSANGHIKIEGTARMTLLNLYYAINLIPSSGYHSSTTVHPTVEAVPYEGYIKTGTHFNKLKVVAKTGGVAGNSIATTTTATATTWAKATLTGGVDTSGDSGLGLPNFETGGLVGGDNFGGGAINSFPRGYWGIKMYTVLHKIFNHDDVLYDFGLSSYDETPIVRFHQEWDTDHYVSTDDSFPVSGGLRDIYEMDLCYNILFGVNAYQKDADENGEYFTSPFTYSQETTLDVIVKEFMYFCGFRLECSVDSDGEPQVYLRNRHSTIDTEITEEYQEAHYIRGSSTEENYFTPPALVLSYKGDDDEVYVHHKPLPNEKTTKIEIPFRTHALGDINGDVYGRHFMYDSKKSIFEQRDAICRTALNGAFVYRSKGQTHGAATFPPDQNSDGVSGVNDWEGEYALCLVQYKEDTSTLSDNGLDVYGKFYGQCLRLTGYIPLNRSYNKITDDTGSILWIQLGITSSFRRRGAVRSWVVIGADIELLHGEVEFKFAEQPETYDTINDVQIFTKSSSNTTGGGAGGSSGGGSGGGSEISTGTFVEKKPTDSDTNQVQSPSDIKLLRLQASAGGQTESLLTLEDASGNIAVEATHDGKIKLGISGSQTGELTFRNATNSYLVKIYAGATAANYELVLPTGNPTAGQVLTASAPVSGVITLSWSTVTPDLSPAVILNPLSGTRNIVEPSTNIDALIIKSTNLTTAKPFQVTDTVGSVQFDIDKDGVTTITKQLKFATGSTLNTNSSVGTSNYVLVSSGAGVAPQWKDVNTLVTTSGFLLTAPNSTGRNDTVPTNASYRGLTITGATSQTADLLRLKTKGTELALNVHDTSGNSTFAIGTDGNIAITNKVIATVPVRVDGASGQTGDLMKFSNFAGTVKFVLDSNLKVAINGSAPNTWLDVGGDIATRRGTYTAANGNNNDIAVGANSYVEISGPTGAFTITGIAGGVDGKILKIRNTTAFNMQINNQDAGSDAANRIITNSGGNKATIGTGTVTLIYSGGDSRWVISADVVA